MKLSTTTLAFLCLSACAPVIAPASPLQVAQASAGVGNTLRLGPARVTVLAIAEDSRCPERVQCVWAGRLRVRARIADGGAAREVVMQPGEAVPTGGGTVALVAAGPTRETAAAIPAARYRFTFRYTPGA